MAVILNCNKPNFSEISLRLLKVYYYFKVEEVVAIALESFRLNSPERFFKNSLRVVLCERRTDPEWLEGVKETIDNLWKEVYPWLLELYRLYPPLKNLIVHHIDYKETHLRICAYADIP